MSEHIKTGHNRASSYNANNRNGSSSLGYFLLKYAISAPSCLNTQPWLFESQGNKIKIIADESRWRTIADADQRELNISAGCALENILIAAEHFRYCHQMSYSEDEQAAVIVLNPGGKPSSFRGPELFEAIPERHTNRKIYRDKLLSKGILKSLQKVCIEEGIKLHLACDAETKRKANDLLAKAYSIQLCDPAFRKELGYWLGQCLFSDSWARSKITQMIATNPDLGKNRAKKFSELLMSASAFGIISSEMDNHKAQVEAGQVLERVWLKATALGIGLHPISQILEIPEIKEEASELNPILNLCPQITFGLGYAEPSPKHIKRRPISEFLI
jgi:nitroreductase